MCDMPLVTLNQKLIMNIDLNNLLNKINNLILVIFLIFIFLHLVIALKNRNILGMNLTGNNE